MPEIQVTPELLAEIEEKAKEATPGDWSVEPASPDSYGDDGDVGVEAGREVVARYTWVYPEISIPMSREDAEYIARAQPATALALVQHIRRDGEAINAALFDLTATWEAIGQVCPEHVEEIGARVEALRKERGSE